jgi:hypothetical protein
MATEEAYAGVTYSVDVAPYTGAEGYTGVAPVPGYTGAEPAPVTAKPRAPRRATNGATAPPSPADAAVMDAGEAPGQDEPLDLSPPPPPPEPTSATPAADQRAADAAQTAAVDAQTAGRQAAVAGYAATTTQALERGEAQTDGDPNRALAAARAGLAPDWRFSPFAGLPTGGPAGALRGVPSLRELIGRGADQMREQVAAAVARTRPQNLGTAYLQGVALGLFDAAVGAAQGGLEGLLADSLSGAIERVTDVMREIDARMAEGESAWEAADAVLNPVRQGLDRAALADELAAQARVLAEGGDWARAVERARDAGRAAAGGGVAAVETFQLAESAVRATRSVRRALTPPAPPAPQPPALPPAVPRPGGAGPLGERPAGGVTGTVAPRAERVEFAPRSHSRPHPDEPRLRVYDRARLRFLRDLQRQVTDYVRGIAARRQAALPPERRLDERINQAGGSERLNNAKAVFNQLEILTALDAALAHPDDAFLLQPEIRGVLLPDGRVIPIETINGAFQGTRGRIPDALQFAAGGRWTLPENKRADAIVGSYSARAAPTGNRILPSSSLGRQVSRETNVIDYARRQGGRVLIRGTTFEGERIDVDLDPARYGGPAPAPYGTFRN